MTTYNVYDRHGELVGTVTVMTPYATIRFGTDVYYWHADQQCYTAFSVPYATSPATKET